MTKNILIILIVLIFLIKDSKELLLKINGNKDKYCFFKELKEEDSLKITFAISAENKKEKINITLSGSKGNKIYTADKLNEGEFKSKLLPKDTYTLCFNPLSRNNYYLSFEFYSLKENGIAKELAQDIEIEKMSKGVDDLKDLFHQFEKSYKFIVDRRSRHSIILDDIIESIRKLTFLKIATLTILSIFQVFIIKRFFGPDKVVKSVKGAFKEGL